MSGRSRHHFESHHCIRCGWFGVPVGQLLCPNCLFQASQCSSMLRPVCVICKQRQALCNSRLCDVCNHYEHMRIAIQPQEPGVYDMAVASSDPLRDFRRVAQDYEPLQDHQEEAVFRRGVNERCEFPQHSPLQPITWHDVSPRTTHDVCYVCRDVPIDRRHGLLCQNCKLLLQCPRCKYQKTSVHFAFCGPCRLSQPMCLGCQQRQVEEYNMRTGEWHAFCINCRCIKCASKAFTRDMLCQSCASRREQKESETEEDNSVVTSFLRDELTADASMGVKTGSGTCMNCFRCVVGRNGKRDMTGKLCTACVCQTRRCGQVREADEKYCTACLVDAKTCAAKNCGTKIPHVFTYCVPCLQQHAQGRIKCQQPQCKNYCLEQNNRDKKCLKCKASMPQPQTTTVKVASSSSSSPPLCNDKLIM